VPRTILRRERERERARLRSPPLLYYSRESSKGQPCGTSTLIFAERTLRGLTEFRQSQWKTEEPAISRARVNQESSLSLLPAIRPFTFVYRVLNPLQISPSRHLINATRFRYFIKPISCRYSRSCSSRHIPRRLKDIFDFVPFLCPFVLPLAETSIAISQFRFPRLRFPRLSSRLVFREIEGTLNSLPCGL